MLPTVNPPWPVGADAAGQLEERALQSARDFIENVATRLQSIGYHARGRALLGTPSDMILREANTLRSRITSYNVCYTKLLRNPLAI